MANVSQDTNNNEPQVDSPKESFTLLEEKAVNNLNTTCILGCGKQLILSEMKSHLINECINVEVDCPQLCGKKVARKEINEHLDHECTNIQPCKLKEFGCTFVARGVDWEDQLKDHLTQNAINHINILAEATKLHSSQLNRSQSKSCQPCCDKLKKLRSSLCQFSSGFCQSPSTRAFVPPILLIALLFVFSFFVQFSAKALGCGIFVHLLCYAILFSLACRISKRTKMSKKLAIGALLASVVIVNLRFCGSPIQPRVVIPLEKSPSKSIYTQPTHTVNVGYVQSAPQRTCTKNPTLAQDWFGQHKVEPAIYKSAANKPAIYKSAANKPAIYKSAANKPVVNEPEVNQPTIRPFKTCMLEAFKQSPRNKKDTLAPVFKTFSPVEGQFVFGHGNSKKSSLVGFISPSYFHGSNPVYVYQDAQKRSIYTLDYLNPEQFPQFVKVGKLGYIDSDLINC